MIVKNLYEYTFVCICTTVLQLFPFSLHYYIIFPRKLLLLLLYRAWTSQRFFLEPNGRRKWAPYILMFRTFCYGRYLYFSKGVKLLLLAKKKSYNVTLWGTLIAMHDSEDIFSTCEKRLWSAIVTNRLLMIILIIDKFNPKYTILWSKLIDAIKRT